MQLEKFSINAYKDEQIIMVIRRHWFNILQNIFSAFAMTAFLVGSFFYLPIFFPSFSIAIYHKLFLFGETFFAMMIWALFFLIWIDYYFDVWIVTSERIINVEQKGLFSREISELQLEKIQDISTEVLGVIPTFLNYGNIFIQTAGEKERFLFRCVPNPYRIKDAIMSLQEKKQCKSATELKDLIYDKK